MTAFELALGRSYREEPRPVHALLAAPLLTRNVSHFERIPGLRLSHPTAWR